MKKGEIKMNIHHKTHRSAKETYDVDLPGPVFYVTVGF